MPTPAEPYILSNETLKPVPMLMLKLAPNLCMLDTMEPTLLPITMDWQDMVDIMDLEDMEDITDQDTEDIIGVKRWTNMVKTANTSSNITRII